VCQERADVNHVHVPVQKTEELLDAMTSCYHGNHALLAPPPSALFCIICSSYLLCWCSYLQYGIIYLNTAGCSCAHALPWLQCTCITMTTEEMQFPPTNDSYKRTYYGTKCTFYMVYMVHLHIIYMIHVYIVYIAWYVCTWYVYIVYIVQFYIVYIVHVVNCMQCTVHVVNCMQCICMVLPRIIMST